MSRSFRLVSVAALALASAAPAACGGGGGQSASELLKETFGGGHQVRSGRLALSLQLDAQGLRNLKGPVSIKLDGPFQSRGKGQLPAFDLSLSLTAGGAGFSAGAVSTGDKGFLRVQGQTFAVTDQLFAQFKQGYEQAATRSGSGGASFKSLGIDPLRWLKDPSKAGTETVGGVETEHVSATVDVGKFLDDVNTLLGKAAQLGQQTRLPSTLSAQQRRDIADSVRSAKFDLWTGKDDKTLRRLKLDLALDVPAAVRPRAGGLSTGTLTFDMTIADLNRPQTIAAPANARPLSELSQALGGLGGLGGATGAGSSGGGAGSSGGASGSSSGGAGATSRYLACLQKAGGDVAKIQQCAALVGQ